MILIKYIDIYSTFHDENGEPYNELVKENATVPVEVNMDDLLISPYYTGQGKLFKNVSVVKNRYGDSFRVVGNYKKLIKLRDDPPRKQVGYGSYTTN